MFYEKCKAKMAVLCNKRYFIYTVRIISWITIGLYAYLWFSNLEYFTEHDFLSIILVFATFGTDYKVSYCKTSFFKRFCEVSLSLLLVFLLIFAMYIIAVH